jgi:type IV pilus assembly protein PilX
MQPNLHNRAALLPRRNQRGAVLIFCLVFLLVLTMMGVASMESAVLEERMAGNMQDFNAAFQAAESSLQTGENWLAGEIIWPATSTDGSTTVWSRDSMDPSTSDSLHWWQDSARDTSTWWNNNGIEVSAVEGVATPPHYIVEEVSTITSGQSIGIGSGQQNRIRVFHRVTARGSGVGDAAVVQLQSTFVKSYE